MTPPSRPWLLPVVCAVLGIAWVLWLADEREPAGEQSAVQAPVTQSTPASPLGGPPAVNPPDPRPVPPPENRPTPDSPSGARAADIARSAIAPAVELGFQTPSGATIGEFFDVRVTLVASQPIAHIAIEVTYDPEFLKGRDLDEVDYAKRADGERAFKPEEINDGRAKLVMVMNRGEIPVLNVPLVQFEALLPGSTQIRIEGISVSDASGRTLTWTASGQESRISIN